MRAKDPRPAHAAPTDNPSASNLLLMTCLGAVDGTIVVLAAQGVLSSWTGAISVGLTVIAGVGAWITARETFRSAPSGPRQVATLLAIAAATSLGVVAAAWIGTQLADTATLHVLPRAIGLVLLLVAADVAGLRLPRMPIARQRALPLPFMAIAGSLAAEGVLQWMP